MDAHNRLHEQGSIDTEKNADMYRMCIQQACTSCAYQKRAAPAQHSQGKQRSRHHSQMSQAKIYAQAQMSRGMCYVVLKLELHKNDIKQA